MKPRRKMKSKEKRKRACSTWKPGGRWAFVEGSGTSLAFIEVT